MKSILMMAIIACLGSTVLFANVSPQLNDVTIVADEELAFSEIALENVPQAVSEAFYKANEGVAIAGAYVAKTSAGELVYKITVKDEEGAVSEYLYKEDGTEYSK